MKPSTKLKYKLKTPEGAVIFDHLKLGEEPESHAFKSHQEFDSFIKNNNVVLIHL